MRSGGWGDRQTLSISFSLSSQSAWALRQKLRGLRQRPLNATLTHKGLLGRSGILTGRSIRRHLRSGCEGKPYGSRGPSAMSPSSFSRAELCSCAHLLRRTSKPTQTLLSDLRSAGSVRVRA